MLLNVVHGLDCSVPYFFVRSFRYSASYRHGFCTEGAGVGDCSPPPSSVRNVTIFIIVVDGCIIIIHEVVTCDST